MECRSVNCNWLYVQVHQWGELPLNKALDKQNLFFYMFHVCELIRCTGSPKKIVPFLEKIKNKKKGTIFFRHGVFYKDQQKHTNV
jgi:hypothetical protein